MKDCVGDAQQQLETTDRTSRQRGRSKSTNPSNTKTDWPTDRLS
jgi:hypothetical protein